MCFGGFLWFLRMSFGVLMVFSNVFFCFYCGLMACRKFFRMLFIVVLMVCVWFLKSRLCGFKVFFVFCDLYVLCL